MAKAAIRTEDLPEYVDAARHAVSRGEGEVTRAGNAAASLERRREELTHEVARGFRIPRRIDVERAAKSELAAIPAKLEVAYAVKAKAEAVLVEQRQALREAEARWDAERKRAKEERAIP